MPKIIVGEQTFEVEAGARLTQAISNGGINIGHRCGGNAKCTTCRVEFVSGEPETMTQAEYDKLVSQDNVGAFRLSCQIACMDDMEVRVLMTKEEMGWDDCGPTLADEVTPEATFIARDLLE